MSSKINPTKNDYCKKIYFSRFNFPKALKYEFGLELIDLLFHELGFKIIYPEQEILDNQIYYLNNSEEFAGISGTLFHNLMFIKNPPLKTYVINKTHILNMEIQETFKMKNISPIFCDFYAAKYPVNYGFGPFIFTKNDNFINFINNNNVNLSNFDKYDIAYTAQCVKKYEMTYKAMPIKNFYGDTYPPKELFDYWRQNYMQHE